MQVDIVQQQCVRLCQVLQRGGAKQFHRELAHSFKDDNNLK